jgi:predicted ferric reductase
MIFKLTWLLALLPGLLALPFITMADWNSPGAWLNLAGRLTGIWGLSLLLVAAMLCCRVPGFDRPFGGLTKVWHLHHQLGAWGFLLVLAHPLLLALGAIELSVDVALATLFTPTTALLWGWVALLALMIFMAPTFSFFGEPEYQRWKWLHRLSGITVVFALVHTFMLNRTLPGLWGQVIWGVFALLTLAAITWRWIFSRWGGRQRYRVCKIERPANNVVELSLEPQQDLLRYEAGQFVYLSPHDQSLSNGLDEEHPYTLSSSPEEPVLRIAIKALGDASLALQSIKTDTLVSIEGPYGGFFPPPEATLEPELWIAGGIGITPFLARLRHYTRHDTSLRVVLVYCVQDESRELYGEELSSLMEFLPEGQVHFHHFYREGPLTLEFLVRCSPDLVQRTAYVCGPTPLLELSQQLLRQGQVPVARIVTEEFVLL